jgi:pyridoxamine 5'-phosphate oxidase
MPSITHRVDYEKASLDESSVDRDPIRQFHLWFDQATEAGLAEPHAATVATASPEGRPSARIVLVRGFDDRGFVFYTNYQSRKGRELEANPFASIVFFWQPLERQVRVEGSVVRASEAESDEYFRSRPTGSKLGAWVSNQSGVVPGREALESELEVIKGRFAGDEIPRPPHWGGFRIVPESIEFWQGRRSRLHDRLIYRRSPEGGWRIERLAP